MRYALVRVGLILFATVAFAGNAAAQGSVGFGAPFALNTNAESDAGDDQNPQVTTDGNGTWVAVWYSRDSLGGTIGTDADILVARSTDAGVSWTAPEPLNTNAASDTGADNVPQLTTDGAGTWVAVWFSEDSLGDSIGTDGDILVARSTDGGVTWTPPAALNTNAASDRGDDDWPQLTADGQGTWIAVWQSDDSLRGTLGTDSDILLARSTDAGVSWTAPKRLNTSASSDEADDWTPQLTTDALGTWVAVWVRATKDTDIWVARSTDAGDRWTAPNRLNARSERTTTFWRRVRRMGGRRGRISLR